MDNGSINKDVLAKFDRNRDKCPLWLTQLDAVLEYVRWHHILLVTHTTQQNTRYSQALSVAFFNHLSKDAFFYSKMITSTAGRVLT
mmetsp:Transcript_46596/g.56036  ORF Transcript_46596/g.56036 Transcript_46596/m.56036 type:complete len:86 (+) Transcript_46596:267-524(+)